MNKEEIQKAAKERQRKLGREAPKPIEEWSPKEWEIAYNELNSKFEKLRNSMRWALNHLSRAQQQLSEAIV